jgi:dTDP-4-dehydrorhamnose 3,5-epimerase
MAPHPETKLVRCIRGAVFDVIVDLRQGSPTYGHWHGEQLDTRDGHALYIPAGLAHGFITLEADTELNYQMAEPFVAGAAAGIVWSDPDLAIDWPLEPVVVSAKDRQLPRLKQVGL